MRRRGFTLLELLVVLGIVALLVSILMPSLSRVREQSRQLTCLNNLRQITTGFSRFAQDHKGSLPTGSNVYTVVPTDWIWYQPSRISQIGRGGIGPYLGLSNTPRGLATMRCPSDNIELHMPYFNFSPYPFSYGMNRLMESISIHAIQNPSEKIVVYEQSEYALNDGLGTMDGVPCDPLGIRHDPARQASDNQWNALSLNGQSQGNVGFCDGHAEYITRNFAHNIAHDDPKY